MNYTGFPHRPRVAVGMNELASIPAVAGGAGSHLVFPGHVDISWTYLTERRPLVLDTYPDMPKYLLLPEVAKVLNAALINETQFLLTTLWVTGARVSEALALTPASFSLDNRYGNYVMLDTLKKRGRPKASGKNWRRAVPIEDDRYRDMAKRYLANCGQRGDELLFPFTRQTAHNRLKKVVADLDLAIEPSCHTFRHSFAVNAILHGRPTRVLQTWLGHANITQTEIYTVVLATETNHLMRGIQYFD